MSLEYVKCPFCGMTKILRSTKYEGGVLKFREMDTPPSEYTVIQLREGMPGPGRGHKGKGRGGFQTVGQISMIDALEDEAYAEVAEGMVNRLVAIIQDYMRAGIISPEDLFSE